MCNIKVQINSEKATYILWFFAFFYSNAENSCMLFYVLKFYRGKKGNARYMSNYKVIGFNIKSLDHKNFMVKL